eukprot:GHUV01043859.1.p1 GENE.GHUV01043859.1~~GHUV01043859.1.p1  ORF type:complete len:171 (-),score=14.88 GHUV01043859.1:173-685(-)
MGSYSQGAIIRTEVSRESQPATQTRGPKKRTGTSKYDFFKVSCVHRLTQSVPRLSRARKLTLLYLQVKVWLGENMDHYYILSRFLICRMLTVTKIPYIKVNDGSRAVALLAVPLGCKLIATLAAGLSARNVSQAVKIALETKKYLVDNNLTDIKQVRAAYRTVTLSLFSH